jgi:hypothetical protein
MGFLTLIMGNKNLIGIGLLLLAFAGMGVYIKVLKGNVVSCQHEKEVISAKLEVSQEAVKNLQSAITEQNTAIDKFKSAADDRVKANQVELNKAQNTANAFKQQATDIMKFVPNPAIPKCDSANTLINMEIKNAKK